MQGGGGKEAEVHSNYTETSAYKLLTETMAKYGNYWGSPPPPSLHSTGVQCVTSLIRPAFIVL